MNYFDGQILSTEVEARYAAAHLSRYGNPYIRSGYVVKKGKQYLVTRIVANAHINALCHYDNGKLDQNYGNNTLEQLAA